MKNDLVLEGKHLSKSFDGIEAVRDFSFTLERGRIVGLIGPNGAGKTTLFNLITGFLPAESGAVYFAGENITGLPPHLIAQRGLARTFQDLRLLNQITVLENVLLACPRQKGENLIHAFLGGRRVRNEDKHNRKKALSLLKFVGLEEKRNNLAEELSYGQQKLLTLACCLATEAELLLLDEPVSGLHPDMIEKMLSMIKSLSHQGKTILFIEHNIEAVMGVSDQVIVMDEGKKIASGKPEIIRSDPKIVEAYLD